MTTLRFHHQAGPIARAMSKAYELAAGGQLHARFPCTVPGCREEVEFTARPHQPHKTAGNCKAPGCIRWAEPL